MRKILFLGLICSILCPIFVLAQENISVEEPKQFSITGTISFTGKGSIYLQLVNKEGFDDEKAKNAFARNLLIKLTEENLKEKKVTFSFKKVPVGTYAIKAFQDENSNAVFDVGTFGPKEPWGMYRPSRPFMRKPTFKDTFFEFKADLLDIQLVVKK